MIYFCADDYGISEICNSRIENCFINGVLNKISVLPNGDLKDLREHLLEKDVKTSLHLNLVEGCPTSDLKDVSLLVSEDGRFKYSFAGLFLLSLFGKRKEMEKQLYQEIKNQLNIWRSAIEEGTPLSIDSHQHTHMIPLIFKTLIRVIKDEGVKVEVLRFPAEPLMPYILTPSLYFQYSIKGLIKQWILKFLGWFNLKELKKSKLKTTFFMGVLFSGAMTEEKLKKLLPKYQKLAEKKGRDIEFAFHPGYVEAEERVSLPVREDFEKFYRSPWRKKEHDTLINFQLKQ